MGAQQSEWCREDEKSLNGSSWLCFGGDKAPPWLGRGGINPQLLVQNGSSSTRKEDMLTARELANLVVEYVTDVEGNWEYFVRFVHLSEVLYWDGDEPPTPGMLRLRENGMLVFGGDAPDKGPGDIRFVKTLLELKRKYPHKVIIILGNRDLIKLRMYAELAPGEERSAWTPPWDTKVPSYTSYCEEQKLEMNLVNKLKWMLQYTMGSQDTTFGTRKYELALLGLPHSDADVVESYRSSVDPRGRDPWMLEFLLHGRIAAILGDTLFVHAGVQDESYGVVPGRADRCSTVHGWADQLNAWKARELSNFLNQPGWRNEGGVRVRGAEELIRYGTPGAGNTTVIYFNPFVDGNPVRRSTEVEKYLSDSGITRVISGHQPHGQTPTVVRHPNTGLLVVTADTSRSDGSAEKLFNRANNRGLSATVVRIKGPWLHLEGQLNDGTKHACKLHTDINRDELPDALVGRQLTNNSWVKTVLKEDGPAEVRVIAALGKGFQVVVEFLTKTQACAMLRPEYGEASAFKLKLQDFPTVQADYDCSTYEDCSHADVSTLSTVSLAPEDLEFNREDFLSARTYIFVHRVAFNALHDEQKRRAVANINQLIDMKKTVVFISNDSNHSRASLFEELRGLGVKLTREGERWPTVTSSYTCAWFLQQCNLRKPFVISTPQLLKELRDKGIVDYFATCDESGRPKSEFLQAESHQAVSEIIKRQPEVDSVVVGWDHQFSALKIAVAARHLEWSMERTGLSGMQSRGIPLISCSMDPTGVLGTTADYLPDHKFHNKKVRAVGNGTMTNAICSAVGHAIKPIDVGKPSDIFLEHLRRPVDEGGLGIDLSQAILVGGSLDTDIRLAHKCGMRSLLLLSGVHHKREILAERNPQRLPTWYVESLADI